MKRKFAIVFLSLFFVISLPFAAHANIVTATGKYLITAIKHIPGGAKVNATNTATGAKHAINHGVSAPALGAAIGGGLVGMALGNGVGLAFQAITGLALDAVDFIMDPTNNQVKWKLKNEGGSGTGQYRWLVSGSGSYVFYSTPEAACASFPYDPTRHRHHSTVIQSPVLAHCLAVSAFGGEPFQNTVANGYLNPDYKPEDFWKKLPLNDLAAKIIEQADAGQVDSQKTIEDYVTNLAKDGKLDAELDAATDITPPEGTEPDDPTKPDDPDKDCPLGTTKVDDICIKPSDPDTPLFCNSGEFTRKVCDWMDWTQEKPTESTEKPIEVKEVNAENSNKINMSGECPAPYELNFSIAGYAQNHSISYQPLCNALVLLKPIFVGSGALSGMFILMGYSRASNTGVNG